MGRRSASEVILLCWGNSVHNTGIRSAFHLGQKGRRQENQSTDATVLTHNMILPRVSRSRLRSSKNYSERIALFGDIWMVSTIRIDYCMGPFFADTKTTLRHTFSVQYKQLLCCCIVFLLYGILHRSYSCPRMEYVQRISSLKDESFHGVLGLVVVVASLLGIFFVGIAVGLHSAW